MDKNVLITLKTIQTNGMEKEETELITAGTMKMIPDGFELCSADSEATGFSGSTTTLTATGNHKVVIRREGTAQSQLIVEKDKKHHCRYGTPFGDFTVGILADKVENSLTESGGNISLRYVIDINSSYLSDFEMDVSVKETQ